MCVGCHALSQNGTRIAVGLNAPTPAPTLRLLDVATRKALFDQGSIGSFGGPGSGSNFEAITPDGAKVITTEAAGLTVRDATTGALVGTQNPAVANADMPDVSSDGKKVVFARGTGMCIFGGFCITLQLMDAGLYVVPFNGTGFGGEKELIAPGVGGNNYYPSFSPDAAWVAFNRSASNSYDAADAKVWAISSSGGNPVELAVVNQQAGNSWPKFAPFVHHFQGSTIFWLTFSSRRPYGLRAGGNPQLWMVAVDEAKLAAGADPGYPPFWLPFQDATTGNHIPQWVQKVERQPCTPGGVDQGGCMPGEMCDNGVCVPGIQ
jgi:TolB protein